MKRRKRRGGSPQMAGECARRLLAALGANAGLAHLADLWRAWPEVVGEELAGLAAPGGHRGDCLILSCPDACAMQEAQARSGEYVAAANRFLQRAHFAAARASAGSRLGVGPVRGARPHPKKAALARAASGRYLEQMDPASPVARCYARFAGKKTRLRKAGK